MRRQISKKTPQPLDLNIDVVAITEQIKKIAIQSERVILTPLAAECCAKAEIEFLNAVQIIRQGIIENIRPEVDQPGAWRFECFGAKSGGGSFGPNLRVTAVINASRDYVYMISTGVSLLRR